MRRCRREIALQDGRGGGRGGICLVYGARDRAAVGGEGEWGRGVLETMAYPVKILGRAVCISLHVYPSLSPPKAFGSASHIHMNFGFGRYVPG